MCCGDACKAVEVLTEEGEDTGALFDVGALLCVLDVFCALLCVFDVFCALFDLGAGFGGSGLLICGLLSTRILLSLYPSAVLWMGMERVELGVVGSIDLGKPQNRATEDNPSFRFGYRHEGARGCGCFGGGCFGRRWCGWDMWVVGL